MTMIDNMIVRARSAVKEVSNYSQNQVDEMVKVCGKVVYDNAKELAIEAVEETQFGAVKPKTMKNSYVPAVLWQDLKGKKSVGVLSEDKEEGIIKIAHPVGVVGAITPVTVPNICPMGNAMLALKGRNAIIISPHPKAKKSSKHTVDLMREGLVKIGAPADLIQIVEEPTTALSQEVMSKCDVAVATGGPGLVKAAYSSGKPAYGVGAGNSQVIVDEIDDFAQFAQDTIVSRSYDNGTACVCAQALIYKESLEEKLKDALSKAGAFIVDDVVTVDKIREVLFVDGHFNAEMVGQDAQAIAQAAQIDVPASTTVLMLLTSKYGHDEILCDEKMCPVMLGYSYRDLDEALDIVLANYEVKGKGHTAGIYSNNDDYIRKAGIKLPVSRLMVNQPTTDAGGGPHNSLAPTTSLGCGSWGNNSLTENLTFTHLLNIQSLTYPIDKEVKAYNDPSVWD